MAVGETRERVTADMYLSMVEVREAALLLVYPTIERLKTSMHSRRLSREPRIDFPTPFCVASLCCGRRYL